MVALKTGTGLTMVIAEHAWRRIKAKNARLRSDIKHDNKLIGRLRRELRESQDRIDNQNERLVVLLAEREECVETVGRISRAARRVA